MASPTGWVRSVRQHDSRDLDLELAAGGAVGDRNLQAIIDSWAVEQHACDSSLE